MERGSHRANKYLLRENRCLKSRHKRQEARVRSHKKGGKGATIKVGYWNIRTLKTLENQEMVHEVLRSRNLDILCVAETWFRADSRSDKFMHEGYKVFTNERAGEAKRGGGLLLLTRGKLKAVAYIPVVPEKYEPYQTERVWSLVCGEGTKVAICFTYLAATSVAGFVKYNQEMYELLSAEVREMKSDGFVVILNCHLGPRSSTNPHGVVGDTSRRNENGTLFLEFVEGADMTIVNNLEVCEGTYTRIEGGFCTVVDFGLVEEEHSHMVSSYYIDEKRKVAHGSDHVISEMTINLEKARITDWKVAEVLRFQINDNTDFGEYTAGIEEVSAKLEAEFYEMNTEQKFRAMQKMIIEGAKKCFKRKVYPSKTKQHLKLPRNVKEKLLALKEARREYTTEVVDFKKKGLSVDDHPTAKKLSDRVNTILGEVKSMISTHKKKMSKNIRSKNLRPGSSPKQFWKMVNQRNMAESSVTAYKTKKEDF